MSLIKIKDNCELVICTDNTCFINLYNDKGESLEFRFQDYSSAIEFIELNDYKIKFVSLQLHSMKEIELIKNK